MRIYILKDKDGDWLKCSGCNWEVAHLYVLASSRDEAVSLYKRGDAGLCGDCFVELLYEIAPILIDGGGETIDI
jgi:hypothetical protein